MTELWCALSLLVCGPSAGRLSDPEWTVRERAESSLRAAGVLAVPVLRRAAVSDDPEARHRAAAILADRRGDLRAWLILLGLEDIKPAELRADHDLRRRLLRLSLNLGVLEDWVYPLDPARELGAYDCWWSKVPWAEQATGALENARRKLTGWQWLPFVRFPDLPPRPVPMVMPPRPKTEEGLRLDE